MATMVLHNFAGAGCNLVKYLTWTLLYSNDPTVKILFYYRNKNIVYDGNDNPNVYRIEKFEDLVEKNIFYKFFQYPPGCSSQSFTQDIRLTLSHPTDFPVAFLPACFANFPILFPNYVKDGKVTLIFGSNRSLYKDPLLPSIRQSFYEQIQKNLQFQPWFQEEIQKEVQVIQDLQKAGKKVLAAFVRSTSHFPDKSFTIKDVIDETEQYLEMYDYIFVTTQVNPALTMLKEKHGDKIISFPRKRLEIDTDWDKNVSDKDFEEEVKMAIVDSYLMSQCDAILSGMSNMFLMSIFFNPTIPFKLYEAIKGDSTL
jgi:hypothetical protein